MSLLVAFILDLILGDPYWLPHPIRYIGRLISKLEKILLVPEDSPENQKSKGVLLTLATVGVVFSFYFLLMYVAGKIHPKVAFAVEVLVFYQMLATRCLADEGMKIFKALKNNDIEKARVQVGYLVSRETAQMSEEDIIKATIETVTENIIDGVVAPLFFAIIGGAPLGMAYKAVNTLDSMVGYKNDKYLHFGWASAKLDDVLGFLPARLTGGIIVIASLILGMDFKRAAHILVRDRNNHASPNSPYAEAPSAGALRIQLGGKATYFGITTEKPTFGDDIEHVRAFHIKKAVRLLYATSALSLVVLLLAKSLMTTYF